MQHQNKNCHDQDYIMVIVKLL